MFLSDVKIIDLKASTIDKEKSDPKKGKYVFKKKVYLSYKEDAPRPEREWWFSWNRHTPEGGEIRDWQIKWGFEFVTTNDSYWPEGVPPNAEGHYIFSKDAVLMRCPLINWVKKMKRDQDKADRALTAKQKEFDDEMAKAGALLDKDTLHRVLGI